MNRTVSILMLVMLMALGVRAANDPDMWWHLATGRLIVSTGEIPTTDPFSYTFAAAPWHAHEWLTQVAMYGLYQLGGIVALQLAFAVVIGLAYWLMYWLASQHTTHPWAIALTAAAAAISVPAWGVRPQMINLLFLAIFILVINQSRWPWLIGVVAVLWPNMHSGWLVGLVVLGVYAVADRRWRLFAPAVAAAALINPYPRPWDVFIYPFETLGSASMRNNIVEWFSPNFHNAEYQIFLLAVGGCGLMLVYTSVKPQWHEWVLLVGAAAAAFISARHIPIFAIVAIPIMAKYSLTVPTAPRFMPRPQTVSWAIGLMAIVAIVGAAATLTTPTAPPAAAATDYLTGYLEQIDPRGRVFNDYAYGGYLIWRGVPVYIDGRADIYSYHLDEYVGMARNRHYMAILNGWGVDYALLRPNATMTNLLRTAGWATIYTDDHAVVMRRVTVPYVRLDGGIEWVKPDIMQPPHRNTNTTFIGD